MSQPSSIEWTDATWNPVRGCSRVSEGCRNCYAERVAARFSSYASVPSSIMGAPNQPFAGFARNGRWTGRVELIPEKLDEPLRWKKPRRIFVNSMSDLFHERLGDEAIAAVFGVMAACPQHTFQILTKRPERMRRWFDAMASTSPTPAGALLPQERMSDWTHRVMGGRAPGMRRMLDASWPLPNVWLGVSVEDQATADERIPLLLQTPAALRFVSYEPAFGPVDFGYTLSRAYVEAGGKPAIDWLIVGGESGPGARPFDLAWARSAVAQCKAAGVPVFVKQLGARPGYKSENGTPLPGPDCEALYDDGNGWHRYGLRDRKGGDPSEWPEDLRVREFPGGQSA